MTNRTEPLYQGTNNLNSLSLGITTLCSMKCPKCSIDVPNLMRTHTARHAKVGDIHQDSEMLRPLKRVLITGGEPTIHPDFEVIAKSAKYWFQAELLSIETNGHFFDRYVDVIDRCFDRVFITHYTKDSIYPGSPDNTQVIERAAALLKDRLIREPPVVHDRQHTRIPALKLLNRTEEEPYRCSKFYSPGLPAGWYDGLLYACCVSVGIDPTLGFKVTPDWREKIVKARMGCSNCCYTGT